MSTVYSPSDPPKPPHSHALTGAAGKTEAEGVASNGQGSMRGFRSVVATVATIINPAEHYRNYGDTTDTHFVIIGCSSWYLVGLFASVGQREGEEFIWN